MRFHTFLPILSTSHGKCSKGGAVYTQILGILSNARFNYILLLPMAKTGEIEDCIRK